MSNASKFRKKAVEFEQLKQFDRAVANYVRAIEESENAGHEVDVALFNKVGDLTLRQGRTTEAVTYYERAVEHYVSNSLFDNAIALCNKILRNAPGRSNVYLSLGRICGRKGLRSDATRNFLEYATRMQQDGRVDEGMRALAEVAELMPELTEIRRMVEDYASRAGISLARKRTTPAQINAQPESAEASRSFGLSKDLVFLEIDYEAAQQARAKTPAPLRSVAGAHAAASTTTAPIETEVLQALPANDIAIVGAQPAADVSNEQAVATAGTIAGAIESKKPPATPKSARLEDLMIFDPGVSSEAHVDVLGDDSNSVVDGASILKPYAELTAPVETLNDLQPTEAVFVEAAIPVADNSELTSAGNVSVSERDEIFGDVAHLSNAIPAHANDEADAQEFQLAPAEALRLYEVEPAANASDFDSQLGLEEEAAVVESSVAQPLEVENGFAQPAEVENNAVQPADVASSLAQPAESENGVALPTENEDIGAPLPDEVPDVLALTVAETSEIVSPDDVVPPLHQNAVATDASESATAIEPTHESVSETYVDATSVAGGSQVPEAAIDQEIEAAVHASHEPESLDLVEAAIELEFLTIPETSADEIATEGEVDSEDETSGGASSAGTIEFLDIDEIKSELTPADLEAIVIDLSTEPVVTPDAEAAVAEVIDVAELLDFDPPTLDWIHPEPSDDSDAPMAFDLDDVLGDVGTGAAGGVVNFTVEQSFELKDSTPPMEGFTPEDEYESVDEAAALNVPTVDALFVEEGVPALTEVAPENQLLPSIDFDAMLDHELTDVAPVVDLVWEEPANGSDESGVNLSVYAEDEPQPLLDDEFDSENELPSIALAPSSGTGSQTDWTADARVEEVEAVSASVPDADDALELVDDANEADLIDDLFIPSDVPTAVAAAEATLEASSRLSELQSASEDDPLNFVLRRRLAEALFEAGQRDAATAEFSAALAMAEQDGNLHDAYDIADGLVRLAGDNLGSHQKRLELAIRLGDQTRLRDAYLDLADAFVRQGEDARARAVYARVLEIDPWDDRARTALGDAAPPAPPRPTPRGTDADHVDLAEWLRDDDEPVSTRLRMREPDITGDEQDDFNSLLKHFKEGVARSLGEDDYDSHYDLGVAYKEMGLLDDAIGEFQMALRGRTNRLAAYEALGQCFLEQQSFKVAVTVLSRALHEPAIQDEQRVGVLYLLGYSYEALQRFDEARGYYQRVYATDIHFRDVAQRLAALDRTVR